MLSCLLGRLKYSEIPNKQVGSDKWVGWKNSPHIYGEIDKEVGWIFYLMKIMRGWKKAENP